MRFFEELECKTWWIDNQKAATNGRPLWPPDNMTRVKIVFPDKGYKYYMYSKFILEAIGDNYKGLLLWVENHYIWPSSENLHMYYKLCESYGEHRKLEEVPGIYFVENDNNDLITFLQMGMLFGWEMYLGQLDNGISIKISNDEFIEIDLINNESAKAIFNRAEDMNYKPYLINAG